MNRNTVIIDGRHRVGDGLVIRADDVRVENLTVRNFDRATRDGEVGGNEIWWNGGDESGRIGIHGWWGRYLTVYDTGVLGGYGIFVSNAESGSMDQVYASGFSDAGLYIGACRDCGATVSHALVERNGLGYSSANAGGRLVVQDSIFRNNSAGIAFASDSLHDPPAPQLGTCDSGANTVETPKIPSTTIARCTIIRRNIVSHNGNLSTPGDAAVRELPAGTGIELAGTYGDLVEDNTVRDNPGFGVLVHEFPDPYPPTAKTVYFQSSGNEIAHNVVTSSGAADLALEGGLFGSRGSVNDCVTANRVGRSLPANLGRWDCRNATTPDVPTATAQGIAFEILVLQTKSAQRKASPQPAPPRQPTMPNPCAGAPPNELCRH